MFKTKRIYEDPCDNDGYRVLVTLLYAAKDEEHNHALVLKEFLEEQQK